MGKVQRFDICYENRQNNVYMSGEHVTGRVYLVLNESLKTRGIRLEAVGKAQTEWTESRTRSYTDSDGNSQTETYYETYSASEKYLDLTIRLFGNAKGASGDDHVIAPGNYEYPFTFQLPPTCPSSFESTYGNIRYTCKAVIDRPWRFDHKCTVPFSVVGTVDLNREISAQNPVQVDQTKTLGCCCDSGNLECHVNLPRGGFVSGESIPLNIQIHNKSNAEVTEVTVKFVEYVKCNASYGFSHETKSKSRTIASLDGAGLVGGDSSDWTGQSIRIPPIAPSLKTCSIINVTYALNIRINPSGCHRSMNVSVPILIGNIPLRSVYQSFAQENIVTAQPRPSAPPPQPVAGAAVEPSAPPAYGDYPDLPPPTYEEAVLGGGEMKGDDEHDKYPTKFKPRYPYFDYLKKN